LEEAKAEIALIDAENCCWSILSLERVLYLKERKAWLIEHNDSLKVSNILHHLSNPFPSTIGINGWGYWSTFL
jgi:hypothetical protein